MRRTCVRKLQFQMGYAITITVPTILLHLWYNFDQVQLHVANCLYTAKTIKLVVLTTEWLPWLQTNWRQRSLLWYGRLTRLGNTMGGAFMATCCFARKMLVFMGVPFPFIAWPQVLVPLKSRPVAYYRESGTTPHLRLVFYLRSPALGWESQCYEYSYSN